MKKQNDKLTHKNKFPGLFLLIIICASLYINGYSTTPITVTLKEIDFNYVDGSAYDGLDMYQQNESNNEADWVQGSAGSVTAYKINTQNVKIRIRLESNYTSAMMLFIDTKVYSSNGGNIGKTCSWYDPDYTINPGTDIILDVRGPIPNYITKFDYRWQWFFTAIPLAEDNFCDNTSGLVTEHVIYMLYDEPKVPCAKFTTANREIFDYACQWGNGGNTVYTICEAILNEGFKKHFTWDGTGNCYELSSNFDWLVSSLGIEATQTVWSGIDPLFIDAGDMYQMVTRSIDPVGNCTGQSIFDFFYHQWTSVEVLNQGEVIDEYQCDPTTGDIYNGDWGDYEDYLFTDYYVVTSKNPIQYITVPNQPGHDQGCEAEGNRIFNNKYRYPIAPEEWTGPLIYCE